MLPNYKRVTRLMRSKGVDIVMVDTDGSHTPITGLFLEGGVNCLYPLEVAAGVDAVKLREEYGEKLLLIGNVDKRMLAAGPKAIDGELQRLRPLLEEGGLHAKCRPLRPGRRPPSSTTSTTSLELGSLYWRYRS